MTEGLELYLDAQGRSNSSDDKDEWSYEDIDATLTDFNYTSDGWQTDNDGINVLRVSGDARVTIPFMPFANDFRNDGKTIEVEFATRNVLDYDATIISCMSGNRGFSFTPQKALLKSEASEISTQYKEDEHVRISFVINKRSENRFVFVYINGIASGVLQYSNDDDFSQVTPVGISIGSNDCTTDIYCIRVYNHNLTRHQIVNNWIADMQIGSDMIDNYNHNDVFDAYGNIVIAQLPNDLPYMILECSELPQYKGDKKTVSVTYVNPQNSAKSFTATGCQANVQGTSSAPYARKNYDLQFKNGFEMTSSDSHADNYALRSTVVPFDRFVLKADVASSEGANNVELVRLYCDISPFQTREHELDSRVRLGIDGFPIVLFWHDTANGTTQFMGKYNFNLPKRAPEPYGYSGDMESWEFQNNTSDLMLFKTDYFDETMYEDPDTGDSKELWRYDYEARFPSDEWTDYSKLQELQSFIVSTDRTKATGDTLSSPVTYDGVQYTTDSAEYRLAKFKAEFGNYAEVDSFIFYYIFTELFLMVDSRAKNLFIGFSGDDTDSNLNLTIDRKAVAEPYDMDTAIGINNEGSLTFDYSLEDTDHLAGGADVFNGQESVLWCNVRDAFRAEIVQMYQTLRSDGTLAYANVEQRFEEHQSKWPEAIFNEDAFFKYIAPLTNPDPGKTPTDVYLPMLQGSKKEQRKWWLYNRFRYMDSKWNAGDARSDVIQLRGYAKSNITITPYADVYPTVKYGSYLVQERGHRGTATTLTCPLDNVNDTEIYIYSASQLADIGDLSGLKVGFADLSNATKLQHLKIGDSSSNYSNPNLGVGSNTLSVGNNTLLQTIDVRNCTAFGTGNQKTLDLSGCTNIEEVYLDGTALQGVSLPSGGILKKLHLPATITNLTLMNQTSLNEFVMPSYSNVSTLRLENVGSIINTKSIIQNLNAGTRVRLIGINWTMTNSTETESILSILDTMRGLDETGGNVATAQISGTIHTPNITGAELASFQARYPYVTFTYDHITSNLNYYTWDGGTLLYTEAIVDGGDGGSYTGQPARAATERATYSFIGWSLSTDSTQVSPNWYKAVTADRNVYAAYSITGLTYLKYYNYDGSELLYTETIQNGGDGGAYTSQPARAATERAEYTFVGWNTSQNATTNDVNCTKTVSTDRNIYAAYSVTTLTYLSYYNYDGSSLLNKETIRNGGSGTYSGTPARTSTAQYSYTFIGWNRNTNASTNDATATQDVFADRNVYAAYSATIRSYTVRFYNGSTLLKTVNNVNYGASATYTGATPVHPTDPDDYEFAGWSPSPNNITGATDCYATWTFIGSLTLKLLNGTIREINDSVITSVGSYGITNCSQLTTVNLPMATTFGSYIFSSCYKLTTVSLPMATTFGSYAFGECSALKTISLPAAETFGGYAFSKCYALTKAVFPVA